MRAARTIRPLSALVALAVVTAAGCGGSDSDSANSHADSRATTSAAGGAQDASSDRKWLHGYPGSIAVLGHSGATGENSDPGRPGLEVRANSWATGSNPKVNSLYLRLLGRNAAIKGHNANYAEAGANVSALAGQADRLLQRDAKPQLIVIQIMDSDLVCPVAQRAVSGFRTQLATILGKLARGAPTSREFVVSQFGSVNTYAKALTREERASQGGTGTCDFMSPDGGIPPRKVARAEKAIHAYEAALKAACGTVRQCTYDDGAAGRLVDKRPYFSDDVNHLSIEGHAELAAVAWSALQRSHVVPKR
jgi:hypothetical protein